MKHKYLKVDLQSNGIRVLKGDSFDENVFSLRPIPGSDLENEVPPGFDRMKRIYEEVSMILKDRGLSWKPEKEVALYGCIKGLYMDSRECPYAHLSLRSHIRDMLNEFENEHPGTKYSIVRGFEKISDAIKGNYPQVDLSMCKICGEPCVEDVCKACELVEGLK